jgi:sugar phosphate isomerase/epimerase
MILDGAPNVHLSYCTNVHPGESWPEVRRVLAESVPAVRDRVAPGKRFGVGLRLGAEAAEALTDEATFEDFAQVLAEKDLYVFTINGFPYGPFHGRPVKAEVYRPDWREPERLSYSDRLAELMARMLALSGETTGSISTVPGAFKPDAARPAQVAQIADNLIRHAAHLVDIERCTGRTISLALEPEPACLIETVEETVDFFENRLATAAAVRRMAELTGATPADAEAALRRHIGVCLDTCHAAVEFEDPRECIAALRRAGIAIAKVQVSAGLALPRLTPDALVALRKFLDDVYLHQVCERQGERVVARYVDLPDAFATVGNAAPDREWRVHFHVPIFLDQMGAFSSTQSFVRDILAEHRRAPLSPHLEVETYTWGVLPEEYRMADSAEAVARELEWAIGELRP